MRLTVILITSSAGVKCKGMLIHTNVGTKCTMFTMVTFTNIIVSLLNATIPNLCHHIGSIRSILIVILMCVTGQPWGRGHMRGGISSHSQLRETSVHWMPLRKILDIQRDSNTRKEVYQALTVPTRGTWRLRLRTFHLAISLRLKRSSLQAFIPWWTACWIGIKTLSMRCEGSKSKRLRRLLTFSPSDSKNSKLCSIGSRIYKKAMKWIDSLLNHFRRLWKNASACFKTSR